MVMNVARKGAIRARCGDRSWLPRSIGQCTSGLRGRRAGHVDGVEIAIGGVETPDNDSINQFHGRPTTS